MDFYGHCGRCALLWPWAVRWRHLVDAVLAVLRLWQGFMAPLTTGPVRRKQGVVVYYRYVKAWGKWLGGCRALDTGSGMERIPTPRWFVEFIILPLGAHGAAGGEVREVLWGEWSLHCLGGAPATPRSYCLSKEEEQEY